MTIQRTPPSRPPSAAPRASAPATGSTGSVSAPVEPRANVVTGTSSLFESGASRSKLPSGLDSAHPSSTLGSGTHTPVSGDGFRVALSGLQPPVSAGGFFTQLKEAAATAKLSVEAAESVASGGHMPSDLSVEAKLDSLSPTPLTEEAGKTTVADYFSQIPNATPQQAYDYFVKNPNAVFGAGDLKVRPAMSELKDGARVMLEQPGTPSVWFPIEVHLDPAQHRINIETLEGHPLRGTNSFQFDSDGHGGTHVNQYTSYQLSSKAVQLGMTSADLQRQHSTWNKVHENLFEHFQQAGS